MQEINYLGERVFKWQRGKSSFLAWPEHGARLMNWNLAYADGSFRDIIHWPDNLTSLDQIGRIRGGNPILFPFCGRCYDGGEIGFWRTPSGERKPMPMHGFAREGNFEVQHLNQNGFSARLLPTEENKECYPYRYEFTVSYRFEELSLYVELCLRNLDAIAIPWSAGHHFYFTLPSREGFSRADYEISIAAKEAYKHAPTGDLVPVLDFLQGNRFDNVGLQDRIHTGLKLNTVSFGPLDGSEQINLRIGTEEKPPRGTSVVTWTESDNSPFYCVEPWMGPPNSPAHKLGLHLVPPGKSHSFLAEIHLV